MEMENSLATPSQEQTSKQQDLSSEAIRQFLVKAGEVYGKVLTPSLISIWVDALTGYSADKLAIMFRRTLETFKAEYGRTFPVIADVLAHAEKVKHAATSEAAEIAWKRVLEIRRVHYNPDLPQYLAQALTRLPERIRRAARAAGVFREHETTEALHVWAKKIFVESFLRWETSEESLNLLPEGEIKNLLTDAAETKALPAPTVDFNALHTRGFEYSAKIRQSTPELSPEARLLIADQLAEAARQVIAQADDKKYTVNVSDGDREAFRKQAERIKAKYPESKTTDPTCLQFISRAAGEVTP
jgi:hypothetical protein